MCTSAGASLSGATYRILDETVFPTVIAEPDWAEHLGEPLGDNGIELEPYAVAFLRLDASSDEWTCPPPRTS
jgi:hypothetical protein